MDDDEWEPFRQLMYERAKAIDRLILATFQHEVDEELASLEAQWERS